VSRRNAEGAEGAEDAEIEGGEPKPCDPNWLTRMVIGAAIEVHRELGPGWLESFYEQALCLELDGCSIPFARQVAVPVLYKGTRIGEGRLDLIVGGRLLVELKATEGHSPLHLAQVLTYLKASRLTLGLLINFNVPSLRQGIRRVILAAPSLPSNA
jgi:GxxExxY protein